MKKYLMACSLIFLSACAHHSPNHKENSMRTNVLSESWVKVDRIEIPVGEMLPTHTGMARVIVSLSDYTIEWDEAGQNKTTKSWKKGDVHWHGAKDHSVKNVGATPARFLLVAKLSDDASLQKAPEARKHDASGDGILPKKVFENESVVVSEVVLQPGQKQPAHHGGQRVIVALSDYEILYNSETVKDRKVTIKNESVHLHEADKHSVSNVGKTEAHYLVIHFK